MNLQTIVTPSDVFSRSFVSSGRSCNHLGCLLDGGFSATNFCSPNGESRRRSSNPISRRSCVRCSRAPERLSARLRGLCRSQAMECPPGLFRSRSAVESIALYARRILQSETFKRSISHMIRCFDFRDSTLLGPSSHGLLLRGHSPCSHRRHPHGMIGFFARVVVRVLLALLFSVCLTLQPFKQLVAPAFAAASPADVDSAAGDPQDFYDILFKKFEEKDAEMGRSQKPGGLEQKLKELHMKVKKQQGRSEAAKRTLEELRRSRIHMAQSISPEEERVRALLGRIFQKFKEKLKGKLESGRNRSLFEEELKKLFHAKFVELQVKTSELEKKGALEKKVREFTDEMRAAERRLEAEALRDKEEAWKQLKAEESQLEDSLARLIREHFSLQGHLQVGDGRTGVSNKQLLELESELGAVWERLLDVKSALWQNDSGSLREALAKSPPLERELEEDEMGTSKDKSTASSLEDFQQRGTHEKVVNDLTTFLNHFFEHNLLAEEPSEEVVDKRILLFLNSVGGQEKSAKKLLEIINNVINEGKKVSPRK